MIFPAKLLTTIGIVFCYSSPVWSQDFVQFDNNTVWPTPAPIRTFFVDSVIGDDFHSGLSPTDVWQGLAKLSQTAFQPGDHIYFKRGTDYSGCFIVNGNGNSGNPIVIGAYGLGPAPSITNPSIDDCNGNAIQIRGDHQIVQNLHFHRTAPAIPHSGFLDVWATGAVHSSLGSDYTIIRGNYFESTPKAIQSYSQHSLISHNFIDGTNDSQQDGFLSWPYWGPIGIHLGIGNQRVAYNIIEDMFVLGGEWDADGGAIEIDDGRYHKNNIRIDHNQTTNNMGFLEISWDDDITKSATSNIVIEHNISRDFQDFVLWWAQNRNSRIAYNTIDRTNQSDDSFIDTVFFLDGSGIDISNNIVIVNDSLGDSVFVGDEATSVLHWNNLYWNTDEGDVDLGVIEGEQEFTANPIFVNFRNQDYRLRPRSPAFGLGAWADSGERFNPEAPGLKFNFER